MEDLLVIAPMPPKVTEGLSQHFNLHNYWEAADKKAFLDVARALYRNDSTWVCPLDQDINNTFDPKVNGYFSHGEAIRWLLKDDSGNHIGRIAAFINENKADFDGKRGGGCGYFECIEDCTLAVISSGVARLH